MYIRNVMFGHDSYFIAGQLVLSSKTKKRPHFVQRESKLASAPNEH